MQWDKDSLVHKWHWENWASTYKRTKLDHYITVHQKINSECTKEPKTKSHQTKRKCVNLSDISLGSFVFFFDTKSEGSKSKTKWDYIKLKSCSAQQGKSSIK